MQTTFLINVLGDRLQNVTYEVSIYTEDTAFLVVASHAEHDVFYVAEYLHLDKDKIKSIVVVNNDSPVVSRLFDLRN